jgi:uncharacterized protein DUF5335
MSSRLIPRDHWRQELDSLSRSHEGWIVRVAVTKPGGQSQIEVHDTPLQGVAAELGREPVIAVMVGDRPDTHLTHQVKSPLELSLDQTETGAVSALRVRSGDGTTTAVEFRSPMRPEEVDGMPARRTRIS